MNSEFWIMKPFNTLFLAVFAIFLLVLVAASVALRGKSEKTKSTVLIVACIVTLLGFVAYKYFLSMDGDYNIITANMGGFNWWGELPLQLCNINMLLIPIAVWKKSRPLCCFCFLLGAPSPVSIPINRATLSRSSLSSSVSSSHLLRRSLISSVIVISYVLKS